LDHTVITNNPRMMVVKGALQNPKELLENRVGGLVNVNRPDGLLPLPQAGLNPFVFQTIQLLDEDKEEVTGVSKLSQGMNKDAVSKQNSAAMMENLVSLSQQREKIIARNFANHFIKPLYLEVYRLVIAHEKKQKVMRVAGNFVPVNPQEWAEEVTCTVELKLGYGEQQMEAQKYMGVHAFLAQDPANARTYTEANRFAMQTKILEKMGIKDANLFLTDPKQLPPAQPDPFKVKEMQLEERKVATQESLAETTAKKVDATAALEQMRAQLERMQIQVQEMEKNRALDIKEFAETSKAALAIRELDLVEKEMEQAPPATQAIVKA
jgi:hypothetical protein